MYGSISLGRKPVSMWLAILVLRKRVKNLSAFFSGWLKTVNPVWRVECSQCKEGKLSTLQGHLPLGLWKYKIIRFIPEGKPSKRCFSENFLLEFWNAAGSAEWRIKSQLIILNFMELKCVNFVRLLKAYAFWSNWQQFPVEVQIREPVVKHKWRMLCNLMQTCEVWFESE